MDWMIWLKMVLDLNFGFSANTRIYANRMAKIEKRKLFLTERENGGRDGTLYYPIHRMCVFVRTGSSDTQNTNYIHARYPFVSVAITIRQQLFILAV